MPIHDRFLNVEDQVFSTRKRSLLSPNTVYLYIIYIKWEYFQLWDNSTAPQFSLTPSDSSLCSPRYSITIADDSIPPEVERDFFSQLYGGDTPGGSVRMLRLGEDRTHIGVNVSQRKLGLYKTAPFATPRPPVYAYRVSDLLLRVHLHLTRISMTTPRSSVFTITEKAPTRAFSWLKALSHLRHY